MHKNIGTLPKQQSHSQKILHSLHILIAMYIISIMGMFTFATSGQHCSVISVFDFSV